MLIERDTKSICEDTEEVSELDNPEDTVNGSYLTVDQLKSRLTTMNIALDLQRHPKSFYVEIYNQSINDPAKRELIKERLEEDKQTRPKRKQKNPEKFINNKRQRTEDTENTKSDLEEYPKGRKNEGVVVNPPAVSNLGNVSDVSNLNKHEQVKISVRTVKIDTVISSPSPLKNTYVCKYKEDLPLLCTPSQNSERKTITSNVKFYSIKLSAPKFDEEDMKLIACAPSNDEYMKPVESVPEPESRNKEDDSQNPKISGRSIPTVNDSKDLVQNPFLNRNTENTFTPVPINFHPVEGNEVQLQQNVHSDFQKIDNYTKHDSKRSVPEVLTDARNNKSGSNSPNYPPLMYKNSKSNNIPQKLNQINSTNTLNKVPSAIHSNKSQPVVNTENIFRFPTNQYLKNEFIRANNSIRSSSNSVNRLNVHNFISRTSQNSDNKSSGQSGNQIKNIFLIIAMGSAAVVLYKIINDKIKDTNFIEFPFVSNNTLLILAIGCLAAILLAYLINWNRIYRERENKLIADNCVQEIKNFFTERQDFLLQEENFINEYCLANNRQVEDFRLNILPFIKELISHDDLLEETHMNINGNAKAVWRIKNFA